MEIKKKIESILGWSKPATVGEPPYRKSYAQHGEDLLIQHLMNVLCTEEPFYVDLGAHHPHMLNNTFLLYQQGGEGINVEPDPNLMAAFHTSRPRDINLQCGVQFDERTYAELFIMSTPVLNTFSEKEARYVASLGTYHIVETVPVPLRSLSSILDEFGHGRKLNLLSVDVEGLDVEVVRHNQINEVRPQAICIETMNYTEDNSGKKNDALIREIGEMDYQLYADTGLNSLFLDNRAI